jgi:hypothetical protein
MTSLNWEVLTNSQSTEEEQERKRAEDPRNLTFWVSSQLMLEQPSLKDTGRVQETRSWKENEPSAEHHAVGFETAVRIGIRDAVRLIRGFHFWSHGAQKGLHHFYRKDDGSQA